MKFYLTLGVLTLVSASACAQPQSSSGETSERRGPPAEAFEVCADKAEGTSCTLSTPRGEMTGTCIAPRSDKLVCAPARGEGRGGKERKN